MQNVVCCEHTRVRCVAITWARCTRGAAVKAPEDRVHRSDYGRWMCVQCARDSPGGAQRKCVRGRGERVPSTRPTMAVAGGFGEMQTV